MNETKKYQKKNEAAVNQNAGNTEVSEMEALPFPLDNEKPAGFKKGTTLTETLSNLREYKRMAEENEVQEEHSGKDGDEVKTTDQNKLKKEFEEALTKEREINDVLRGRIDELSQELEKNRDRKYTQEDFEQEAIKTFVLVKDVLLVEMKRSDPDSAAKLENTVNAVFTTLTDYPEGPEEGKKDE
ncbi:MAG: hypothetical protein K6F28_11540 [Lachnospiraceae bacterium]|nr:hypothetical protein [Lachnospiraceae bacterium]